ncbi:hypothetical protein BC826DRAFT_341240 [Russula brevipes]|nr:hypothetical protein BC826DRAFT_341240 [Russula brevipes]
MVFDIRFHHPLLAFVHLSVTGFPGPSEYPGEYLTKLSAVTHLPPVPSYGIPLQSSAPVSPIPPGGRRHYNTGTRRGRSRNDGPAFRIRVGARQVRLHWLLLNHGAHSHSPAPPSPCVSGRGGYHGVARGGPGPNYNQNRSHHPHPHPHHPAPSHASYISHVPLHPSPQHAASTHLKPGSMNPWIHSLHCSCS